MLCVLCVREVFFLEKPEIGFVVHELSPTYQDLVRTYTHIGMAVRVHALVRRMCVRRTEKPG